MIQKAQCLFHPENQQVFYSLAMPGGAGHFGLVKLAEQILNPPSSSWK